MNQMTLKNNQLRFETSKYKPSQMNRTSLKNNRLKFMTLENLGLVQRKLESCNWRQCTMSGIFAWTCICIPDGSHFSFLHAYVDQRTTKLAFSMVYNGSRICQSWFMMYRWPLMLMTFCLVQLHPKIYDWFPNISLLWYVIRELRKMGCLYISLALCNFHRVKWVEPKSKPSRYPTKNPSRCLWFS
jgi:hypothetical protein